MEDMTQMVKICLQGRRHGRWGFNIWGGRTPWRRAWLPTPAFLPRESHGQRSLVGYNPWGCKESDTTSLSRKPYEILQKRLTYMPLESQMNRTKRETEKNT